MIAAPSTRTGEQLSSVETDGTARSDDHDTRASSGEFQTLLGNALASSSPAVNQQPDNQEHAPRAPRSGFANGEISTLAGALGPEAPGTRASHEGAASEEPDASGSPRPGARKRRESAGPHPSAQTGPAAVGAAQVAAHAAAGIPERTAKSTLVHGTAKVASAHAVQQPLATPSPAKPAATQGREREKAREREPSKSAEPTATAARLEQVVLSPPAEAKAVARTATPLAPARPASPLPPPPAGQDVSGAVLRNAAHLRVELGALGAVSLHMRVHEGALHLRVDGEAAGAVEARAGELSRALAGDGLRLAPIEFPSREGAGVQTGTGGDGGRQGEERREAWNEAADTRGAPQSRTQTTPAERGAANAGSDAALAARGGVHVKA